MREVTHEEKQSVIFDTENMMKNSTTVEAKGNRAARRNALRANKGLSKQKRDRNYPNYRPVQNAGGGMRRHDERASEAKAKENDVTVS